MTAYYNELDPYAAQWLRNLIAAGHIAPGVVDERSIVDVRPEELADFTQCHFFAGIGGWSLALRMAGWPDGRKVWTGSCPCQPFSVAGKGAGFADERHLWPAWFWLIRECRPSVVFGEQVASKDADHWIDLAATDMEGEGYAWGSCVIPAAGIGAPHDRHRTWFVAHAGYGPKHAGCELARAPGSLQGEARQQRVRIDHRDGRNPVGQADRVSIGCEGIGGSGKTGTAEHSEAFELGQSDSYGSFSGDSTGTTTRHRNPLDTASRIGMLGHGHGQGLALGPLAPDERGAIRRKGAELGAAGALHGFWADAEWLLCRPTRDGQDPKWRPVEPTSFPLAPRVPGDVECIKAYGNAIVPQVAAEVIAAFMECRP